MKLQLSDLTQVLEEELSVGNELRCNLDGQRQAILAWDIAGLLERIEAREAWLGLFNDLEERRRNIMREANFSDEAANLRRDIAPLIAAPAEKARLLEVGERARRAFIELKAEEDDLHRLMSHLNAYLKEALAPLLRPDIATYGESGIAEQQRPPSALVRSRA